ncbi:MAG: phosphomannomutase [Planctomycetota bacterium]|nr:phosphomannomutase [Planctomycetota bacterium]
MPMSAMDGEMVYGTPAAEFELGRSELRPDDGESWQVADGAELLVVVGSVSKVRVTVRTHRAECVMNRGGACIVPSGLDYSVRTTEPAVMFRARTPGPHEFHENVERINAGTAFRGKVPRRLGFGTSGLRGLVSDLTDLEAYINTCGFLEYLIASGGTTRGGPIAIAGDLRVSTDSPDRSILRAVRRGVADSGFEPTYCGRIPTPALSLYAFHKRWPSIMVTGSHIPFDRNGIKFNKPSGEVLKSDEAAILAAVDRVRRTEYAKSRDRSIVDDDGMFRAGCGTALPPPAGEARDVYARRYLNFFPKDALSGMRIVVYEHSAVGRELLVEILRGLGAEVHPMGRTESFVPVDTEAVSGEMLHELQRLTDAAPWRPDAIVSTDGDSDRPMVAGIDSDGTVRFFSGDLLGIVVADYLRADSIVVPVSATDAIDMYFQDRDVRLVRTRIGSPWVIAAMATQPGRRCVGWESNGGFLVGSEIEVEGRRLDALPTRDAILPIAAALHGAAREGITLIELFELLPQRFTRAGLLDAFPTETSRRLLQRFSPGDPTVRRAVFRDDVTVVVNASGEDREAEPRLANRLREIRHRLGRHFGPDRGFGRIEEIDFLDGIRIYFHNADIAHLRPSGNAPQLRIYAIADDGARADAIVRLALAEPDGILREMEES